MLFPLTYEKNCTVSDHQRIEMDGTTNTLPKWINRYLTFYSLWGFHYMPIARTPAKYSTCICVFQIVLCLWCSYTALHTFSEIATVMDFIDALNMLLYYMSCTIAYWCIIYDSLRKRKQQRAFWWNYAEISRKFGFQTDLPKRNFLVPSLLFTAADLLICVFGLIRDTTTSYTPKLMNSMFLLTFDHRILFYMLHLRLIAFQLKKIDDELTNITARKIKRARIYYGLVHEMTESLNGTFGISNLALFLLNLHSPVAFLNFFYRQLHAKFEHFNNGEIETLFHRSLLAVM